MKKTLTTMLIFALILAALLAATALVERARPETAEPPAPAAAPAEPDEAAAVDVTLAGETARVTGAGAVWSNGTVTMACPGTYCLHGQLTDGQIVVDCGDLPGTVYLVLDGVDITSTTGPAIHVVQAEETVLLLAADTENTLRDGADYTLRETVRGVTQDSSGAAVYSADDLLIQGDGALTVYGQAADGIRSKDGLTLAGGTVTVYAADDTLQGSDHVTVTGGSLALNAGGDGVNVTEGYAAIESGVVNIICTGDGIAAAGDAEISGGEVSVLAGQGAAHYEESTLADISAKGVKGVNVTVTGGVLALDTAGDGLHADGDLTVTGGRADVASGDDALRAEGTVTVTGGEVAVSASYEALEAAAILLSGGTVTVNADTNGADAGPEGLTVDGGALTVAAAVPVKAEGPLSVLSGTACLFATGTEEPPVEAEAVSVTGGTLAVGGPGTDLGLTAPASFQYVFSQTVAAGTGIALADSAGRTVLCLTAAQPCRSLLIASGALGVGQEYTLTAGSDTLTGTLTAAGTVVRAAGSYPAGGPGMRPGMPPMPPRG